MEQAEELKFRAFLIYVELTEEAEMLIFGYSCRICLIFEML